MFRRTHTLPPVPYVGYASANNLGIPTANMAVLYPIWLPAPQTFRAFRFFRNGAGVNSIDLAILRADRTRLFSTGTMTAPVVPPLVTTVNFPTGPIGLAPGPWYIALSGNGVVGFFGWTAGQFPNRQIQFLAASFPIPATLAGASEGYAGFLPTVTIV